MELPNGIAIHVPTPPQPVRVLLQADWYACDTATGILMTLDTNNNPLQTGTTYNLDDPFGMVTWDLAAQPDEDGDLRIPSGFYVEVWQPPDVSDGHWELLHGGQNCQGSGSGSGSGGGSGGSGKGSGSSGSGCTPWPSNWPKPPNDGNEYVPSWVNGCLTWRPVAQCSTYSGGSGI